MDLCVLESQTPPCALSRYSIAAFDLLDSLTLTPQNADSFESELQTFVDRYAAQLHIEMPGLPFSGGVMGWLGYEKQDGFFAVYRQYWVWDHHHDLGWKIVFGEESSPHGISPSFQRLSIPKPELTEEQYMTCVNRILAHIRQGDIYQANFSYRFSAVMSGDLWPVFARLREVSPAPFGAFLRWKDGAIASASPEEFIRIQGRHIQTRPIKGTSRRGQSAMEDQALGQQLLNSEKNRAELTMIIDLMRNDLSRICDYGSVKMVDPGIILEAYAQVFHLVATIEGELRDTLHPVQALFSVFPGGSITGAPKRRAMEILDNLEVSPRSVYTGCIGYFGFDGCAHFNIAIRTVYCRNGHLYFHAGGGIVADSDPQEEWAETQVKASGILAALDDLASI